MQTLKDETDRQNKRFHLDKIIRQVHYSAISQAKATTETSYKYVIIKNELPPQVRDPEYDFIMDNIDEIIYNLNLLFPECSVQLKKFATMSDRTIVDVSTIGNTTERILKCKTYIVIDWS